MLKKFFITLIMFTLTLSINYAQGTFSGIVTDALTGNAIEGATVAVAGLNTTTASDGTFSITGVPEGTLQADFNGTPTSGSAPLTVVFTNNTTDGTQTVTATKTGYIPYTNTSVTIINGETTIFDISLSPTLSGDELRFVLNWGLDPRDLDSHLLTPTIEGYTHHVYFGNIGSETSAPYAKLDHDDTQSYGPETITIYNSFSGTYRYYVYNYAGAGEITSSGAVLQIYTNIGLVKSFQVPTTGTGRYWYVCDVDGDTKAITTVNIIQDSSPTSLFRGGASYTEEIKTKDPTTALLSYTWAWNFGDGTSSAEQHPTHVYSSPGTYTVILAVNDGTNSDAEIKTDYISVGGTGGGTLTGVVTDALTGAAIEGATVSVAGLSATTASNGSYTITAIPEGTLTADFNGSPRSGNTPLTVSFVNATSDGTQTVTVTNTGHIQYTNTAVTIIDGQTTNLDISLSPNITGEAMRFVLNWGAEPRDLDSHLLTPEIEGFTYHVYYSFQGYETSAPYAKLDHDDQQSYGPETVTIYNSFSGTYRYYVYNFAGEGDIISSSAVVQVYTSAGLARTFQVPTSGTGRYWYVCDVDGNTQAITPVNTIQDSSPLAAFLVGFEDANNRSVIDLPKSAALLSFSYSWNFGDGSTSTDVNPTHIYTSAGTYTVNLTVTDGTNSDTETKANYITVTSAGPVTIFDEGFESYGDFSLTCSPWILNDVDAGATFGISEHTFPNQNAAMAYIIFNPASVIEPLTGWDAHGGDKYAASFASQAPPNNDWIITPQLNLGTNTILTFWVRSITATYGLERYKVGVSTTGTQISDFTIVTNGDYLEAPVVWTEISVDLSSYDNESVYIGINCVSNDAFVFMLDDVKLISNNVTDVNEITDLVPTEFRMSQNFPNPFNPSTRIDFSLPEAVDVKINVHNQMGQLVKELTSGRYSAGDHYLTFQAGNLASGIYYYTIQAGSFSETKKMLLLK